MARKVTKAEREHFGSYVREIARLMWLGSWSLSIEIAAPENDGSGEGDTLALCNALPEYRSATISFSPSLLTDRDPFTIRDTVVHELIHCHHAHVEKSLEGSWGHLAPAAAEQVEHTDRKFVEDHITVMTRLIAEGMPEYVERKASRHG